MAKKSRGARPTRKTSASTKKRMGSKSKSKKTSRSTRKKTARKAAPRRVMLSEPPTGLESDKEVDFRPLKTQIGAHIERLSSVRDPGMGVQNALRSLKQVQSDLSRECSPTMVIDTP